MPGGRVPPARPDLGQDACAGDRAVPAAGLGGKHLPQPGALESAPQRSTADTATRSGSPARVIANVAAVTVTVNVAANSTQPVTKT